MALNIENIVAELENATILELSELVKAIEEKFDVTAAAKDSFDVELTSAGDKKVAVIKEVRGITGLGLKEAKELVDGAPTVVKEGLSESEANEIKEKLEAAGASITLK